MNFIKKLFFLFTIFISCCMTCGKNEEAYHTNPKITPPETPISSEPCTPCNETRPASEPCNEPSISTPPSSKIPASEASISSEPCTPCSETPLVNENSQKVKSYVVYEPSTKKETLKYINDKAKVVTYKKTSYSYSINLIKDNDGNTYLATCLSPFVLIVARNLIEDTNGELKKNLKLINNQSKEKEEIEIDKIIFYKSNNNNQEYLFLGENYAFIISKQPFNYYTELELTDTTSWRQGGYGGQNYKPNSYYFNSSSKSIEGLTIRSARADSYLLKKDNEPESQTTYLIKLSPDDHLLSSIEIGSHLLTKDESKLFGIVWATPKSIGNSNIKIFYKDEYRKTEKNKDVFANVIDEHTLALFQAALRESLNF